MIAFVGLPVVSLFHFVRKFVCHYPKSCWLEWTSGECARITNSKGDGIDIVPGVQPYAMVLISLLAFAFLSRHTLQVLRKPT
jgi:hypothetical protein